MRLAPTNPVIGHLRELAAASEAAAGQLASSVERYAQWVLETLEADGTLFFCGNGGSASTAEHIAAEYVVRFRRERRALRALSLAASGPLLTATANDFGFEEIFARSLKGLARPGDLLVLHSTSGSSSNLLKAAETASSLGVRTVGILAGSGGRLGGMVDLAILLPTDNPAIVQELQLAVEHGVVGWVEEALGTEGMVGGADDVPGPVMRDG